MDAVIGQEKLVKTLESYTLQTLPKAMFFLGPSGCGKGWIAARLAESLDLDRENIDADTPTEKLMEYYQCPIPKMYIINLKDIDEKHQNRFLKFIEEPSSNMFVVVTAESEIGVLPTILNRCKKFRFEKYTKEQLQELSWMLKTDDELIYELCPTPGQLLEINAESLKPAYDLCETIVTKAKAATFPNIIKISTKINCKDNYDKIDFELFFKMLSYVAFKHYKENNDEFAFKLYLYLVEQQSKRINKSIAKESYLLSFLSNLWEMSR